MNAATLERVKKWASDTHDKPNSVQAWSDVAVDGAQLFVIYLPEDGSSGAAVIANQWPPLEGAGAMRALLALGPRSPLDQARLALRFLEQGGELFTGGAGELKGAPENERALLRPPTSDGKTLEYWYRAGAMTRRILRSRVDLTTMSRENSTAADLLRSARDPLDVARDDLMNTTYVEPTIVARVVALCADPRAAKVLNEAVQKHRSAPGRAYSAQGLASCHDASSVDVLIGALADPEAQVRKEAAEALGAIGDRRARPALEKLGADADANVRGAVMRALTKLPK